MRTFMVVALLACGYSGIAAAQPSLVTCGVNEPWELPLVWADSRVRDLLGCTQQHIDDTWNHFHMSQGGWSNYGVNEDACNLNTPLGRTIAGATLLKNAGANPSCDGSGTPLDWAYCYTSEIIVYLKAECDGGGASARTYTWGLDQWNERTELYKAFYYDFGPPMRAATLYHEARHAEDNCSHTINCPASIDNELAEVCDPQFEAGCVGGEGKGAYAWSAIWLHRYAVDGHAGVINQDLRAYAVGNANFILGRNFEVTPCFTYIPDTGHLNDTGCPK